MFHTKNGSVVRHSGRTASYNETFDKYVVKRSDERVARMAKNAGLKPKK